MMMLKKIEYKELIFPLLVFFSLFDWTNLWIDKKVLGILGNISLGDAGIFLCLSAYVILFKREIVVELVKKRWATVLGVLFLFIALISGLTDNPFCAVSLKYWIKLYLLFFILVFIFRTSTISRLTLNLVCALVIIINLIGILEYFYHDYMTRVLDVFRPEITLLGLKGLVASVFGHHNIYGQLNALLFVILLSLKLNYKNLVSTYLLVPTLILALSGIFLSLSRSAMLTMLIGLSLFMLPVLKERTDMRAKDAIRWICFVLLICCIGFVLSMKYNTLFALKYGNLEIPFVEPSDPQGVSCSASIPPAGTQIIVDRKFLIEKSGFERLHIWKVGMAKFKERPLLGWGTGMSFHRLGNMINQCHLHNTYLEILVTNGILGFMLIACLVGIWLFHLRSAWCWSPVVALLTMCVLDTFIFILTWIVLVSWLVAMTTKDLTLTPWNSLRTGLPLPQVERSRARL